MQAIELGARAVALDPRRAGIDHVADSRHRKRGFGHVGGQHQAPLRPGIEYPILVAAREPSIQRQDFGFPVLAPLQCLVHVADLTLARQEHQHVAEPILTRDLVYRRHDGLDRPAPATIILLVPGRAIAHLHRMPAPLHAEDRGTVEVLGKPVCIDGGRGHHHLQIWPARQYLADVAQQKIDVEAALVRLVDDDGVVGLEQRVGLRLGQQDAVGHELDRGCPFDSACRWKRTL
jgi:hypothetical protein